MLSRLVVLDIVYHFEGVFMNHDIENSVIILRIGVSFTNL
jgi:hypothetical protein